MISILKEEISENNEKSKPLENKRKTYKENMHNKYLNKIGQADEKEGEIEMRTNNQNQNERTKRSNIEINMLHNGKKERKKCENLNIMYMNVAGLNKEKSREIELIIEKEENTIMLLTETHMKSDCIEFDKSMRTILKVREHNDKKGGGLLVIFKRHEFEDLEEVENRNKDIMIIKGERKGIKFKIVLLYLSVINKRPEDEIRNERIRKEIEKEMEKEETPTMIIGDFNGHVEGLGYQREDKNGKTVLDWASKYNMVLLNQDERCSGEITWSRNNQFSVIDFVLVDEGLYKYYKNMKIDEEQEIFSLSDHNLIKIEFETQVKKDQSKSKDTATEYICTKEESLELFTNELEKHLLVNKTENMTELIMSVQNIMNCNLKKRYIKKAENDVKEKPWFNKTIKKEISIRKQYNRAKRNVQNEEEREMYTELYKKQKEKVQAIIKEEISKYENKLTKEIRNNKVKPEKKWKYINELRGIDNNQKDLCIYNEKGEKLEEMQERQAVFAQWSEIYSGEENNMSRVWNQEKEKRYKETKESQIILKKISKATIMDDGSIIAKVEEMAIPANLVEHYDMEFRVDPPIRAMGKAEIKENELIRKIKELKNKKASGPDGIKNEIWKAIGRNEICRKVLLDCMNNELTEPNLPIPPSWKTSITKAIPKVKKPTAQEIRPIALTDTSYKLLMSILSEKIEKHLMANNQMNECQAGFTRGRRIEDNIFILEYLVEQTRRRKEILFATAIDFKKAYDSVKRETIIQTMMYFKIDESIINLVMDVYSNDKTNMIIREGMEIQFVITVGIRQGCNLSATIFKMITLRIMNELERKTKGIEIEGGRVRSLFYADDGLLMENTQEETIKTIKSLKQVAGEYGLIINKEKSKIIVFNKKN